MAAGLRDSGAGGKLQLEEVLVRAAYRFFLPVNRNHQHLLLTGYTELSGPSFEAGHAKRRLL